MDELATRTRSCRRSALLAAAMLGIVAFMLGQWRWEIGVILSLLVGLVTFGVIAAGLLRLFCSGLAERAEMAAVRAEERAEARRSAVAEEREKARARQADMAAARAGQAEAGEDGGSGASAAALAAAGAPTGGSAAAGGAEAAGTTPPASAAAEDARQGPELLPAPREGRADDLKQIRGIGPALEKKLNELGIWHFDQIANWTDADIAWVDSRLGAFRGRIRRDDWIGQARRLAAGEETEFSARVKRGEVYD